MISMEKRENNERFVGTRMTLFIGGKFQKCRMKVLQYFQQLAIITPYANLRFSFTCPAAPSKSLILNFERQSEHMPPLAKTLLPHPLSLNLITLSRLLDTSDKPSLRAFLLQDVSGIDIETSESILQEMVN
jgi:DNA topoisomerase VI subunit B